MGPARLGWSWTVAGVLALTSGLPGRNARAETYDLEILTPHNENIQQEFERAFIAHVGRPLKIRWIKKGTVQIMQQLDAQQRAMGDKRDGFELDLFFGGGVPDHDDAARKGYVEPASVPDSVLSGIPSHIAGVANYDSQRRWYGTVLSSFGILQNKRGLANQNLPLIERWEDLAQPRMFSWVVLADPRKSASVAIAYELILQQYGWEAGWPLLMRMGANARQIADSSSAIPNEVATGNALAGPCIDFYGLARVAQAGQDVLEYLHPLGGSAITPDPIALLRKAPHKELAEQFIVFVLSPEGQRIWVLPAGTPGGPTQHSLYRMPIRPDVCEQYADQMLIPNPYKAAEAGTFRKMNDELQRKRNKLVAELFGTALVELQDDCRGAWKALIDSGLKSEALAEWNKLPFTEEEGWALADRLDKGGVDARRVTRDWNRFFKAKYDRVRELCK